MPWSRVWQSARTTDISQSGLSFELPSGVCFKGLPVEVAVDVPSAAFRSRTRVVRTQKDEAGRRVALTFTRMPEHLQNKLKSYVDRFRHIDTTSQGRAVFSL